MCGLPGSGKSTLAQALAPRLGGLWFSSDRVRVDMGLQGDYSGGAVARVYRELISRALRSSAAGTTVVIDATFGRAGYLHSVLVGARHAGARTVVIELTADTATTLDRVGRQREFSEAKESAYHLLKQRFEPITVPHLTLDTSAVDLEMLLAAVETYLATNLAGA